MREKLGSGISRRLICSTLKLDDSVKGTCKKCGSAVYYSRINKGKFSEIVCNDCFWNDDKMNKENAYVTKENFRDSMLRYLKTKRHLKDDKTYVDFTTDAVFGKKEKLEVGLLNEKMNALNNMLDMFGMGETKPEAG